MSDYDVQVNNYKRLLKAIDYFEKKAQKIQNSWFKKLRLKELNHCLNAIETLKAQKTQLEPMINFLNALQTMEKDFK